MNGKIVIRKSTDEGRTWSEVEDETTGLLTDKEGYHTAPTSVLVNNNRVWKAFEYAPNPDRRYWESLVISASTSDDLLRRDSWKFSDSIKSWENYQWIEGNVVVNPRNQIVNILRTNLRTPALLSKEFSKNIRGKNNNIINIIDQRVFKLTPYFFSYTISKTGLYTLTKTSAMSLAPNIRVNGIAPGPTIKNKRQSNKHFKKQYLATPLKKQVDVNEICNAVDFFIKNSSITGQVLAIDSGQNLNWQTPDVIGKE